MSGWAFIGCGSGSVAPDYCTEPLSASVIVGCSPLSISASQVDVTSSIRISGSKQIMFGALGSSQYIHGDEAGNTLTMHADGDLQFDCGGDRISWRNSGGTSVGEMNTLTPGAWIFNDSTSTEVMRINSSRHSLFVTGPSILGNEVHLGAGNPGNEVTTNGLLQVSGGMQFGISSSLASGGGIDLVYQPFVTTASINVTNVGRTYVVFSGSSPLTATLGPIMPGRLVNIKRHWAMGHGVEIETAGGNQIDGAASLTLTSAGDSVTLLNLTETTASIASHWHIF